MAIEIKGFSVIIPRSLIDSVYPGGSEKLIHERTILPESYDEYLISFSADDSLGVENIISEWTDLGLRDIRKRKGKRTWIDICLADSEEGPTLPCKWIKFEKGSVEYRL